MPIRLDLGSLTKETPRLAEALEALRTAPDHSLYRDATLQRFEFTYELAHKLLHRYLQLAAATPQTIDEMPFPDLIRTGCEQGLLRSGWDRSLVYRKARGTPRHTNDADKAMDVLAIVPDFLAEANHPLGHMAKGTEAP